MHFERHRIEPTALWRFKLQALNVRGRPLRNWVAGTDNIVESSGGINFLLKSSCGNHHSSQITLVACLRATTGPIASVPQRYSPSYLDYLQLLTMYGQPDGGTRDERQPRPSLPPLPLQRIAAFWYLFTVGYWHIITLSHPRGSPSSSDAVADFLPGLFMAYGIR